MKKKVFCALLCTAMVASLTACGGSSSSTAADTSSDAAAEETTEAADDTAEADTADAAASEGGKIFGYTCMDGTNPFFVTLEGAIREVVESHGDQLISMDPANDSNTQVNQIEDMISRGVEVMFVNPVDADGIIPGLDMLKEAGVGIAVGNASGLAMEAADMVVPHHDRDGVAAGIYQLLGK